MSKKIAHLGTVTLDTKLATSKQLNADEILANGEDVAEMFSREQTYREMTTRVKLQPEDNYILYGNDGKVVSANLSGVTNGTRLFSNQSKLTEIPLSWKLDSITDGASMCESCTSLTTFLHPLNNLSNGSEMFNGCNLNEKSVENILKTIPIYSSGTHALTLNMSADAFEKFNEITENYLMAPGTISYKGWELTSNAVITIPVEELTDAIEEIVGEGKVIVDTIPTENKVVVHTDRADDNQLEIVTMLLERVLPQGVEVQRANYLLPTDYKWVEYLEGTGTQYIYVPTDVAFAYDNIVVDTEHWCTRKNTRAQEGRLEPAALPCAAWGVSSADSTTWKPCTQASGSVFGSKWLYSKTVAPYDDYIKYHVEYNANVMHSVINDEDIGSVTFARPDRALESFGLFTAYGNPAYPFDGKKKYFKLTVNSELIRDMIPALDSTGAPCFFDLVTKTPFYNQGSDDFLYPSEAATYSMRRTLPGWGKLTKHGLRRLYHAPKDYTGELIDYALANGFKTIVEPEMPEEGYWSPRWMETEEEIILEWDNISNTIVEKEELTNV